MKQVLIWTVIPFAILIPCASLNAQQEKQARDKFTLLTMAYNQRPLTLYKGQFQANAAYRFGVRTKSYDENGDKISLKQDGAASIVHTYLLEV